ncbi:hypothetical protein AAE478_001005 [Parahypoxylon ruwenzoriense]
MAGVIPQPYRRPRFQRVGGWLPYDSKILLDWLREHVKKANEKYGGTDPPELPQEVKELDHLVKNSTRLRMLASAMLDEVPDKEPYNHDPVGGNQIRDWQSLLNSLATAMGASMPKWVTSQYTVGLIGFPFNAILDWPMATPSGYSFFLDSDVNTKLKAILDAWNRDILATPESLESLVTGHGGWLCQEARDIFTKDANLLDDPDITTFEQVYDCNPDDEHYGFVSFDDFFTRKFTNFGTFRPIGHPSSDRWIVNSCESKPFSLQSNVKESDTFWLKGQAYSVADMLNHHNGAPNARDGKPLDDKYYDKFPGGTVYQAFLSATSYHRWHSPVSGKVVYTGVVSGTYFSEPTITGFSNPEGPDPAAPDKAQGYITHVATRAIFVIDTEGPVGLVCAIYVGMADVSSTEINDNFTQEKLPAEVTKGDEIGMFHYGGSTHCLLFEKGKKLTWVTAASSDNTERNIAVRSDLAYLYE